MISSIGVSDVDIVFGGRAMELLPAIKDIPKDFREGSHPWYIA
ncbi:MULTISPECIES: hypothetical protein [Bacillus]|nr:MULTISPECIES: hypothetical protein [Bacillus]MCR1993806.1 hypothetical protein [Bacillus subtilis]MCT6512084.1 hypothetical protein [Bacillus subtilis]MEC0286339.1 hypothetical protein [Bacillus subtilis]MEC0320987.1 hypothetical protein [Bacillus subtilis]MEC0410689.1 hypothetical protein [Bacillus subtilis]